MKTATKLFSVFVFSLAFMLMAQVDVMAQGRRQNLDPEEMAQKQTERMTKRLSLSDEQKTKVEEVNLRYATKMKEQMDGNKGNRDAMRTIMEAMRKDQAGEMKGILSEDQYKKYEKMMSRQGGRGEGGRRGKRGE